MRQRWVKSCHLGGDRPEELGPHGPGGARPVPPAVARERIPRRRDRDLHVLCRGRRDVAFADHHPKTKTKGRVQLQCRANSTLSERSGERGEKGERGPDEPMVASVAGLTTGRRRPRDGSLHPPPTKRPRRGTSGGAAMATRWSGAEERPAAAAAAAATRLPWLWLDCGKCLVVERRARSTSGSGRGGV